MEFNKKKVDKIIKKLGKQTVGISVAVIEGKETVYKKYFGHINSSKDLNCKSSKMMIGSNGKVITAIAVFQLYEKGLISLEDNISKYIPELKIDSRFASKTLTIRNILMHRSGLASDNFQFITTPQKLKNIVKIVTSTPLSTEPGTTYAYSNIGYGLLGVVIERISNVDYVEYVRENIFKPLNTSFEYITTPEKMQNHKAIISDCFDNKHNSRKEPLTTMVSAGTNLYGTLSDMKKLMKLFLHHNKKGILKEETINLMLTKPVIQDVLDGEIMHGLGLIFNMYNYNVAEIGNIVTHGGDTMYHHSRFVLIPQLNAGIIVMTNTQNGFVTSSKLTSYLLKEYLQSKNVDINKEYKPSSKRVEKPSSDKFVGWYNGPTVNVHIFERKSQLYAKIRFLKMKLHLREDEFFDAHPVGLSRLPVFSSMINNMHFCVKSINDKKILCVREFSKSNFNSARIGVSMCKSDINEFIKYTGNYQLKTNNKTTQNIISDLAFAASDGFVSIKLNIMGSQQKFYLSKLASEALEIIGFGRYAGDTLSIEENEQSTIIKIFGLTFERNKTI